MVEGARLSKTGKNHIDQSLGIDTILAAIAYNLVCNVDGAINADQKTPPWGGDFRSIKFNCKFGMA
jgi:hypothetical protein